MTFFSPSSLVVFHTGNSNCGNHPHYPGSPSCDQSLPVSCLHCSTIYFHIFFCVCVGGVSGFWFEEQRSSGEHWTAGKSDVINTCFENSFYFFWKQLPCLTHSHWLTKNFKRHYQTYITQIWLLMLCITLSPVHSKVTLYESVTFFLYWTWITMATRFYNSMSFLCLDAFF